MFDAVANMKSSLALVASRRDAKALGAVDGMDYLALDQEMKLWGSRSVEVYRDIQHRRKRRNSSAPPYAPLHKARGKS